MDEQRKKGGASRRRTSGRTADARPRRSGNHTLALAIGFSLAVLLALVAAVHWKLAILPPERRIAALEQLKPEPEIQDPELDKARELYAQTLELMARRRFDEAAPVIEQARSLHLPLLKKYEQHPRLSKLIEGQDRELCHQERLLSERATARELRGLALESQKRMRRENLRNALSKAEELCKKGRYDEAVDLLTTFAEQHKDFEVAAPALEEAERLKKQAPPPSEEKGPE